MRLNAILAAATLALGSAAASAENVFSWGEHDNPVEVGFGFSLGAGTTLSDTFNFTLSSAASILGVGVSNDGGVMNLVNGMVTLFQDGNPTPIGSFSFDSVAVEHSFGLLPVGSYHYLVTGTVAADALAGQYVLNSQMAPVPEPESYALMLAGLGAVGYMARRRRSA